MWLSQLFFASRALSSVVRIEYKRPEASFFSFFCLPVQWLGAIRAHGLCFILCRIRVLVLLLAHSHILVSASSSYLCCFNHCSVFQFRASRSIYLFLIG
jgi:hypothetical protein